MTTSEKTHRMALLGEKLLQQSVLEELRYKAKLDQYVIINRDGKPFKISAKEAVRIAEQT